MKEAMKRLITSATKIAAAIFLSMLGVAIVVGIYLWAHSIYKEREAKPYQEAREWTNDLSNHLGMKLTAKTKLVSETLYVIVRLDGYPAYLDHKQNDNGTITLHFVDSDGFIIHSRTIKIREMLTRVDDNHSKSGLRTQYDTYVALDSYKQFADLKADWTLITRSLEVNKVLPALEKPKQTIVLDHCEPNIDGKERLRRLGLHGQVRQTAPHAYTAGGRLLSLYSNGDLLDCR